jgi:hypothetical protein
MRCYRKLLEKCSFTELLPLTIGSLRPTIPDIAAISGIWGPGSWQLGVIPAREGPEAVQQARLV